MTIGSIASAVGGLIGGHYDREFSRAQSAADRAFQREVYQNQIQWKAADARKAGLHPLAVIGTGSYSASPSSVPSSSSMADSLGKLGEGIGDSFTAYMNKDEIAAAAAKKSKQEDEQHDANMREAASRIYANNAQALESTRRAMSYTIPMSSGREVLPGQTDSDDMKKLGRYMDTINKYAWPIYPDGSKGDPVPSETLSEAYENAPGLFAYTPYIDAAFDKWRSILTGKPIDGHYHDWRNNRWTTKRPPKHPWRFWAD